MRATYLTVPLGLCVLLAASSFAAPLPGVVSPDNLNPARGASRFTPFVTGPLTPIRVLSRSSQHRGDA